MNDRERCLGIGIDLGSPEHRNLMVKYINLKLAALEQPIYLKGDTKELDLAIDLIENLRERNRILHDYLCPVDKRIQDFLDRYLADIDEESAPSLPPNTLILDRYGLARELSIAPDLDRFLAPGIESYRISQGILNNPKHDRRTTKGVFHVAAGGFPVASDKKEVPKVTFRNLLAAALAPPEEQTELPFTSSQTDRAHAIVSLLLRPMVCPEVPGFIEKKDMEIRFFAPGNYVCNLDFVESIFGNGGDPFLPLNDAGLDPDHWTGYTGCVILAPHICGLNKKALGLPHVDDATERQRRDGMCWTNEDDVYNDGLPFKCTARDESGVIVTLIADNYFGYCKKEVKTQIGFASNLYGLTEEEHAGGAMATPRFNLGASYHPDSNVNIHDHRLKDVAASLGDNIEFYPEGFGRDREYPDLFYIPEDASFDIDSLLVTWKLKAKINSLKILSERTFVYPTGFRVNLVRNDEAQTWRLVGTVPEGTLCHKPCTVSGGGKSEISKSIQDAMLQGPVFVADYEADMNAVEMIINRDYSNRFKEVRDDDHRARPILSPHRSLGSVIKLLNASPENTDTYNSWLRSIPNRIKGLVCLLKRFYRQDWGSDWRRHFSVDFVNGELGHELKFDGRKMIGNYIRVGSRSDGTWRTSRLRTDFIPSQKVQWEDDISASIVVPSKCLENLNSEYKSESVKIVDNCEYRFFQRPDDAVIRGYDKQAESDLASPGNFISNFEPLHRIDAMDLIENEISFNEYTHPMQELITGAANNPGNGQFVASSHPRIVDGAPTKNPRYLETRKDLLNGENRYSSLLGMRLFRKVPAGKPLYTPVNAVLPGRRNNPIDREAGIRPLAVYCPIHYQELPELFMDFICSLTGKSPSTTGAGTEGALTKGPFNALVATADLNNALLSFILTGYDGFSTAAGYIGSKYKVDHDISLLIPELWCRMTEEERNVKVMINEGFLEKVEDFEFCGMKVKGSRLGYRITRAFVNQYLGKIFETPNTVFEEDMLKPELQGMEEYIDGINNIVETHQRIAQQYLDDGTVEGTIPPLKALLHIMATGSYEGKTVADPEIRKLFTREYVIESDWYHERLVIKQKRKVESCKKHIDYLKEFMKHSHNVAEVKRLGIEERLKNVKDRLKYVRTKAFIEDHIGTIGADPIVIPETSTKD